MITSFLFLFLIRFTLDMHMFLFCSACVTAHPFFKLLLVLLLLSILSSYHFLIVFFYPSFYVSSCHSSSVFSPVSHYFKACFLASWIFYLNNIHISFWQCYCVSQIATLTTKDTNIIRKEAQRISIKWVQKETSQDDMLKLNVGKGEEAWVQENRYTSSSL